MHWSQCALKDFSCGCATPSLKSEPTNLICRRTETFAKRSSSSLSLPAQVEKDDDSVGGSLKKPEAWHYVLRKW